jgi:hypothetical protein
MLSMPADIAFHVDYFMAHLDLAFLDINNHANRNMAGTIELAPPHIFHL